MILNLNQYTVAEMNWSYKIGCIALLCMVRYNILVLKSSVDIVA